MPQKSDIPEIKFLLAKGYTDRQIGKVFGTCKETIYSFRRRHNIRTNTRRGRPDNFTGWHEEPEPETHPLRQIIENGIRITFYPARWAHGAWPQKNLHCHE